MTSYLWRGCSLFPKINKTDTLPLDMRDEFLSPITSLGTGIFGLILVIFTYLNRQEHLSAQLFVMLVFTSGIGWAIKFCYKKKRPDFDPKAKLNYQWIIKKFVEIDEQSFPSLHSARSAGLLVLLASYFQSVFLRIFLLVLTLLVCSARLWLKRHYLRDVIGGFVIGLIVSACVLLFA